MSIIWLLTRCGTGDSGCGCIMQVLLFGVYHYIMCTAGILPGTPLWYDDWSARSCEHQTRNHWHHSTTTKLAWKLIPFTNNGDYCKVNIQLLMYVVNSSIIIMWYLRLCYSKWIVYDREFSTYEIIQQCSQTVQSVIFNDWFIRDYQSNFYK